MKTYRVPKQAMAELKESNAVIAERKVAETINKLRAEELAQVRAENERLREGLTAAIRAAKLAIFVIRKQNVMPNSSWESGFEKDLATATAARGVEQQEPEGQP